MDTIFSKIIRGEIPCTKVYEDNLFLAFLDINPVSKGHTLIIPKEHYTWIHEAPDEIVGKIFILSKKIINSMRENLPCDYVQVGVVGNEVPHFHVHLIPRHIDETVTHTNRPHTPYVNDEEKNTFALKIKKTLE